MVAYVLELFLIDVYQLKQSETNLPALRVKSYVDFSTFELPYNGTFSPWEYYIIHNPS